MFDYTPPDAAWLESFDFDELSLHSAILKRDTDRVSQLLRVVDVDQRLGSENLTPLEVAVLVGDPEILRILLAQRNIQLEPEELQRHTPRQRISAPRNNARGVVAEFIQCPQIKPDEHWATYLLNLLQMTRHRGLIWLDLFLLAFDCESYAWMIFLLKQVDQVNLEEQKDQKYQEIRNKRPVEAFEYACREKQNKLIDFLVQYIGDDIENYRDDTGQTILLIAAFYRNVAAVDKLLDAYRYDEGSKLDINHVDDEGRTPLFKVLQSEIPPDERNNVIEIIKLFLQLKADVNEGMLRPLLWAALEEHADEDTRIVELFLEHPQTRIDIREEPGQWTALHTAARAGNSKVIDLLLKSPKTPKLSLLDKDAHGNTAIHMAVLGAMDPEEDEIVREKCRNTIKFLLQQDENWNEVLRMADDIGFRPIDIPNDDKTLCLLKLKKEIKAEDLAKLNEMKEFEKFRELDAYQAILSPTNNAADAVKFMKIVDLFYEEFKKLQPKVAKGTRSLEFLPKVDESKIEPEKYDQIYAALKNIQDEYCRIKFLEDPVASPKEETWHVRRL